MMTGLDITLNIDEKPWLDCKGKDLGSIERIARIPNGTKGGLSAVAVAIRLPDGSLVIGQTTLLLLSGAVSAFKTRDAMDRSRN